MPKRAISVTLRDDNLVWLRGRSRAARHRSVSETLDRLIADARPGGRAAAASSRSVKVALGPRQLDLFVDGQDALLIHEAVTGLLSRDAERAEAALARLRGEHPAHPDLRALTVLVDGLDARVPASMTHADLMASVEAIERELVPAARRFFGTAAPAFLRPLWQALATVAASRPFDAVRPHIHAGWLHQQYDDWGAVRAAVESEPGWAATPLLRYWLGLARHHLGEPEGAIRLWLPLCWVDPALFARHAPTLPNAIVREGWEMFERAAHLFAADDIPETGPDARAFRALLAVAPLESQGLSDELIARRRALRAVSAGFFSYYMEIVRRGQ